MTTTLAIREGLIGTPTANGLLLPPDLTLEEWASAIRLADHLVAASPWWLADLLVYGEDTYGEEHSQALPDADEDPLGASQARMKQAAWMGRVYPRNTRVPGASYTHHRVVADLPPVERRRLLDRVASSAEAGTPISTRDLARQAKQRQDELAGRVVDAAGVPVETVDLVWSPTEAELTEDARRGLAAWAPQGRLRSAWMAGAIRALVWAECREAFRRWGGEDE